jgi:DNA repair exonuclease SbcCD ATPase subunit
LRIIGMKAENIKKLRVVELTPNKYMNRVSGANGSGKTSILDALEWGLVGGKNIPSQPVRRGAVRAAIKLDVGDTQTEVVLTRQFYEGSNKKAGRIFIEQKPGADASEFQDKRKKITTPDELEDALLKQVSFDPLEFLRMEPKKQYHVLRRISTPDIDMDALDETIQEKFDERTVAGRKRDQLEAQRNAIQVPEGLPTEKRDEAALVKQLTEASDYNAQIERERMERSNQEREREQATQSAGDKANRIAQLRAEIERIEVSMRQDIDRAMALGEAIANFPPLPEPRNSSDIAEEINQARTINRQIDRATERAKIDREFMTAHEEWSRLDAAVKEGERRKKEAIAHAQYPVEGLGFGNQEVMYKGLPFEQASNAEQIKVSAAIGMATNSKVRVMRIRDGSLLDNESLEVIADMARAHDFQVWIEIVDETGSIGIYLEDGEIAAVNDEPLDKPPLVVAAKKKPRAKKVKVT